MKPLQRWIVLAALVACWACLPIGRAFAQSIQDATPEGFAETSATVEAVMTQAVKNIAKRYNLNEYQIRKTDEMMRTRVREFLITHEADIWPALQNMLAYGMGTKPPTQESEAMDFANRMRPLARMAAEAIFEGNDEWRKILDDQQKSIHDFDMREMRKTFDHIDHSLGEWQQGRMHGNPLFGPPPKEQPPSPATEPPLVRNTPRPAISTPDLDILETMVEEFIRDNNLDEGQKTAALTILSEFRGRARSFEAAKREEFAKLEARERKAKEESDVKAIKEATARRKELIRPFYLLIEEMEDRLEALLTSAQRERYMAMRGNPKAERPDDDANTNGKPKAKKAPEAKPKPESKPESETADKD